MSLAVVLCMYILEYQKKLFIETDCVQYIVYSGPSVGNSHGLDGAPARPFGCQVLIPDRNPDPHGQFEPDVAC